MIKAHWQRFSLILATVFLMLGTNVSGQDEKPSRDKAGGGIKKTDVYGDPLPEGARVRMGTLRWRHPAMITFVGFTAKDKQVMTACGDGFFRVWDAASGKEIRKFGKPQGNMFGGSSVMMQPGGGRIMRSYAYGGGGGTVLSPDSKVLAEAGMDGSVRLWNIADGKDIRTLGNDPKKEKDDKGGPPFNRPMRVPMGIASIAFSPAGKTLATRGFDQVIRLWDTTNGKEIRSIGKRPEQGKQGVFYFGNAGGNSMAFLGDGKAIVSLAMELENRRPTPVLRIYDIESGKELRQIKSDQQNFFMGTGLAVLPKSKTIAWPASDGTVGLYDADSGKEIRRLGQKQQNIFIRSMLISADGKIMATQTTSSPEIRLWDVASGKPLRSLGQRPQQNPGRGVFIGGFGGIGSTTFAFSADGKTFAEATPGNTVRLWKVDTGKEIVPPVSAGHHGDVHRLAVSADGKVLTTFGQDQTIRQWDMASGKELRQHKLPANVHDVALTDKLAAWSTGAKLTLVDVTSGKEIRSIDLPGQKQGVVFFPGFGFGNAPAISANGKLVAVRGLDQGLLLFDTDTGKEFRRLVEQHHADPKPNGGALFIRGYGLGRSPMAFSADGAAFAAVSSNIGPQMVPINMPAGAGGGTLRLWNLTGGKNPRLFETKQAILELAVTPGADTLVSANADNTISLWEALTGKECLQIKLQRGIDEKPPQKPGLQPPPPVMTWGGMGPMASFPMALSADGRTLATVLNRTIRLFDLRSGKELGQFKGHEGAIVSLVFAPDNRILISGSADTTALVWDAGRFLKKTSTIELKAQNVDQLWKDLGSDPVKAYQAIGILSAAPKQAVTLVKEKIKPAPRTDEKRIERLIADLDSDKFQVRQTATKELEKIGELAEPALQKAVKTLTGLESKRRVEKLLSQIANDQVPSAEVVRTLRAVQVLRRIGTPEARTELERLAKGAPGDKLTRSAETALRQFAK
jgi:WD40 repeat protein